MTILVDKGAFVAVAVDDTARYLIKPGDTILVLASISEVHEHWDGGDFVRVRFGTPLDGHHLWIPWTSVMILTERQGALLDRAEGEPAVRK